MATIERRAQAVWSGDLRSGSGTLSLGSGVLTEQAYSFHTRFEQEQGTNPEELLAAALGSCFTMALGNVLAQGGHPARVLSTEATCRMDAVSGGFKIQGIHLRVRGGVDGLDQAGFEQAVEQAAHTCPVSQVFKSDFEITHEGTLE